MTKNKKNKKKSKLQKVLLIIAYTIIGFFALYLLGFAIDLISGMIVQVAAVFTAFSGDSGAEDGNTGAEDGNTGAEDGTIEKDSESVIDYLKNLLTTTDEAEDEIPPKLDPEPAGYVRE